MHTDLPLEALLQHYAARPACDTDCYSAKVPRHVDLSAYVGAFYTTWLFRLERAVLRVALHRRSTDAEAIAVAAGTRDTFAAWTVEARSDAQLLMCDIAERTRSWFMVAPEQSGTRLYFGSAVVPYQTGSGAEKLGHGFTLLLGLHRIYSKALLRCAVRRLARSEVPAKQP